jgi:hypothetical protein
MTAPPSAGRRPTDMCHRVDAGGLEDVEGGVKRTSLCAQPIQLVDAEGGVFGEDERDVLGYAERGEACPPPGVQAFGLRGLLQVVIGHASRVIRTRAGAAGRREVTGA